MPGGRPPEGRPEGEGKRQKELSVPPKPGGPAGAKNQKEEVGKAERGKGKVRRRYEGEPPKVLSCKVSEQLVQTNKEKSEGDAEMM